MSTIAKIIAIIIAILFSTTIVNAYTNINDVAPVQDGRNCELVAKYYAQKYHTDLYIIVPLKDNGALDLSDYGGHIINSKIIDGNRYYFEFGSYNGDTIMISEQNVKTWYYDMTDKQSELYNTNNAPFPIIWHY